MFLCFFFQCVHIFKCLFCFCASFQCFKDVENEEMRPEDQQTINQPTLFSTLYFPADLDSLYANCSYHHNTKLAAESSHSKDLSFNSTSSSEITSRGPFAESRDTDYNSLLVYSVVQLPKMHMEPTGQTESNENDPLYSLAQRPEST